MQIKDHVMFKCSKFNITEEAVLFRVEFHSPLPSSGYGSIQERLPQHTDKINFLYVSNEDQITEQDPLFLFNRPCLFMYLFSAGSLDIEPGQDTHVLPQKLIFRLSGKECDESVIVKRNIDHNNFCKEGRKFGSHRGSGRFV